METIINFYNNLSKLTKTNIRKFIKQLSLRKGKSKKSLIFFIINNWFHIFLILFVANVAIFRTVQFIIHSQSCLTREQISVDTRCLYILGNQYYEKGSRNNPHKGHDCGTDITEAIKNVPIHLSKATKYLDPNLRGNICATTPNPTPTLSPTPSPTPTLSPTPTPISTPTSKPSPSPTATPKASTIIQASPTPQSNSPSPSNLTVAKSPTPTPKTSASSSPSIGGSISSPTPSPSIISSSSTEQSENIQLETGPMPTLKGFAALLPRTSFNTSTTTGSNTQIESPPLKEDITQVTFLQKFDALFGSWSAIFAVSGFISLAITFIIWLWTFLSKHKKFIPSNANPE